MEIDKEQRGSVEDFIDKLLLEDDEYPEFGAGAEWVEKERGKETTMRSKVEWDDDAEDDFSQQLKKELESEKSSKKDGSST